MPRMKRFPIFFYCLVVIALPTVLKLSLPPLVSFFADANAYRVVSITPRNLTITNGSTNRSVSLVGIHFPSPHWQAESLGVVQVVLRDGQESVFLAEVGGTPVVRLSNGILLQEVLLADGVAQVDAAFLSPVLRHRLEFAQDQARHNNRNIWGNDE